MSIPRERIFHSRDTSFLPGVMGATGGRGVDVVLNSLSGELLHTAWRCLAEFGTFVEIGRRDLLGHGRLAMEQFESNRSFVGFDLAHLGHQRPRVVGDLMHRILKYYKQGYLKPVVASRFSAINVTEAFRSMQKAQHIGKMVVTMPDKVEDLPFDAGYCALALRPDRAYLLAGGLGGLGRSVAVWLATIGAGHLVFLSRSAGKNASDDALVRELAALNCHATLVSGDVTKYDDVLKAVRSTDKQFAGVFQASMVLRVRTYSSRLAPAHLSMLLHHRIID